MREVPPLQDALTGAWTSRMGGPASLLVLHVNLFVEMARSLVMKCVTKVTPRLMAVRIVWQSHLAGCAMLDEHSGVLAGESSPIQLGLFDAFSRNDGDEVAQMTVLMQALVEAVS